MRLRLGLRSAALVGLVACASADPVSIPATEPVAERTRAGDLRIRWERPRPVDEVLIYAGVAADAIDRSRPVAVLRESSVVVEGLPAGRRPYFELDAGGSRRMLAERRIPLTGAPNFRDLGGYRSGDGRRVRWGMLYRSGALAELSDRDLEIVADLGIRTVCDFRTDTERVDEPDRLPESSKPAVAALPIGDDDSIKPSRIRELIRSGEAEKGLFEQLLIDANRAFIAHQAAEYSAMLARLSDPANLPGLVHCTAGKDRAGVASAVLLLALGVPRETILEDYLLTNLYLAAESERTLRTIEWFSFFRTDREDVRPLFDARPEYLQTAFATIDEIYGSDEAYLRNGLGLSETDQARMQRVLLD